MADDVADGHGESGRDGSRDGYLSPSRCSCSPRQPRPAYTSMSVARFSGFTSCLGVNHRHPGRPGMPVQTITVINQTHANPWALARVTESSLSLSRSNSAPPGGRHAFGLAPEDGHVISPGLVVGVQSRNTTPARSPTSSRSATNTSGGRGVLARGDRDARRSDDNGSRLRGRENNPRRILAWRSSDERHRRTDGFRRGSRPVEERGYKLDGVYVSDFVFPAYFAGAPTIPTGGCDPSQGAACGPPIAPADVPGPYDEMGLLTAPWRTRWGADG